MYGRKLASLLAALTMILAACDGSSTTDQAAPVDTEVVQNVPADPATGRDPNTGQPVGNTGHYTLFSVSENRIVTSGSSFSAADSASATWDIGFRGTNIIVNGGASGPGTAGLIVVDGVFEDYLEAPTSGYVADAIGAPAIPTGSGNGWYNYNPATMTVTPIPGRFIVLRTADGHYAKIKILSYYRDAPDPIDPFSDAERYYTFEHVFQPDGSTALD